MDFVFWQGIISIHQKAFLEALALHPAAGKVMLIVEQDITPYRKDMGWEVPEIRHVEIRQRLSAAEINTVVAENTAAIHIMGGIRNGQMMTTAFDACVRLKCRLGIMTEPFNDAGIKGWLRVLKYQYYRLRYFRYLQFVLAIGRQGVRQFADLGFSGSRIFPWAYFVDVETPTTGKRIENCVRIIYAGRLEEGKGIYRFVSELSGSARGDYRLHLYGSGPDEQKLRDLVSKSGAGDKIVFFPFLKHEELLQKYIEYDWVVLPSTGKDGWGVIISEGLLNGLRALVSGICGVSWVVKNGVNGEVFDWSTSGSCQQAIDRMMAGKGYATPGEIVSMSRKAITGQAGAAYFMKIMECVYQQEERPGIPWLL